MFLMCRGATNDGVPVAMTAMTLSSNVSQKGPWPAPEIPRYRCRKQALSSDLGKTYVSVQFDLLALKGQRKAKRSTV